MLEEILSHLRNWFIRGIHEGTYTITTGLLEPLLFLEDGQYFRIVGSDLNDGVYKHGETPLLRDETFAGEIWVLSIPNSLLAVVQEIEEWQEKNGAAVSSPYQSESFGGYSYTKAAGVGQGGAASTWQGAFSAWLNTWRKL